MQLGTLLLLALAAWLAYRWVRKQAKSYKADRLPAGVKPPAEQLGAYSREHYEACLQALRAFAAEYKLTFQPKACSKRAMLALHDLRDEALGHMYQLRMRLPNDLGQETEFTRHIEETDSLLRGYVQEAQARCNVPLLHPGPLDDSFYRTFYRAHNDAPV